MLSETPARSDTPEKHRRRLPPWLISLSCILVVLGALWPAKKPQPFNVFDQPFYIGIAYDLLHEHRFTNGYFLQLPPWDQPRASGMRFTPVYPALVAAAAKADPAFAGGMACLVQSRGQDNSCPRQAPLIRSLQFLMLTLFYLLVWWLAKAVSGSGYTGGVALALALMTAPDMLNYVDYIMTEITCLTLVTLAMATAVKACTLSSSGQKHVISWLCLSGISAGLAALTRPAFCYLFVLCVFAGLLLAMFRANRFQIILHVLVFACAGSFVIGPWILRNDLVMGKAQLSEGYGAHVLNERIAFDEMSRIEYLHSFVCWLPDGNAEGAALWGPGACHRFQWADQPDNFYAIGNGPLMRQSLAASGGWPYMFDYLMRVYIFPHILKHAFVTLSLALRGAWISNYWGLILMPVCAVTSWQAVMRRNIAFLIISLPAWFMLIFAAAISVNQPRYNLMLIPAFAIAGGMTLENLLVFIKRRFSPSGNFAMR